MYSPVVSGSPKPPCLVICLEDSQNLAYSCVSSCDLSEGKICRGKRCLGKVWRKPGTSFWEPSPSWVAQDVPQSPQL